MLKVITKAQELDICKLRDVYAESLGDLVSPGDNQFGGNTHALRKQEQFYSDIYAFLKVSHAFYGIWTEDGNYVSAVRVEQFSDGMLLSGLETTPKYRGQGFAKNLVEAVAEYLKQIGITKLYSHVSKNNCASLSVHRACGFEVVGDTATFLDGSASSCYVTLCRDKDDAWS